MSLGIDDNKVYKRDELELLEEAAEVVLLGRQYSNTPDVVCQIRAAAVKASPKDEKLALDCLRACINANDLGYAMEVSRPIPAPILNMIFEDRQALGRRIQTHLQNYRTCSLLIRFLTCFIYIDPTRSRETFSRGAPLSVLVNYFQLPALRK